MTTNIYDQHDAAFARVSAYAILKNGAFVASIAFRYPRDGAGRLWAYVHWKGEPMVRGYAAGGGYDKDSAAVASAVRNISGATPAPTDPEARAAFITSLRSDGGRHWYNCLRGAGFEVCQAV